MNTRVDLTEEGLGVCDRPVSVLNIRSLLVFLFSQNFGVHISEKALHQFWSHATEHFEWGPAHPGRGAHVPLGLYGDSARYTNSAGYAEKLLCITLSLPLYSPKSVRSSRYLIFSIRESLMVDFATTIWPIYSYIMQELNQLFHSGIPGPQGSAALLCASLGVTGHSMQILWHSVVGGTHIQCVLSAQLHPYLGHTNTQILVSCMTSPTWVSSTTA